MMEMEKDMQVDEGREDAAPMAESPLTAILADARPHGFDRKARLRALAPPAGDGKARTLALLG